MLVQCYLIYVRLRRPRHLLIIYRNTRGTIQLIVLVLFETHTHINIYINYTLPQLKTSWIQSFGALATAFVGGSGRHPQHPETPLPINGKTAVREHHSNTTTKSTYRFLRVCLAAFPRSSCLLATSTSLAIIKTGGTGTSRSLPRDSRSAWPWIDPQPSRAVRSRPQYAPIPWP